MRTNSWSWESKSENTSRSSAPQMGCPEKARLFQASPSPQPFSPRYSGYSAALAQSQEPASTQALVPRCHPPRLPDSLCPVEQRFRSGSALSPRHRPGAPNPPTRDHHAESRTPPHALRASSCCARATGPQSAVPILPGR